MKRTFDQISNDSTVNDRVYDNQAKRKRIETQRIGDFIVDAKKAVNFRISSNINRPDDLKDTSSFFSTNFIHFLFGQQERISGYEGLSIDITLSSKKLIPYIHYSYESKAPAFANIDNIEVKFQEHYGKFYNRVEDYLKIQREEDNFVPMGQKLNDATSGDKTLEIYKVSLDDEAFHEQNFYLQAVLPFFIDGASVIEPSPFWKYFLIYDQATKNLLAYATVFEAHHNKEKFRARISQVLVLPPYQRQGLGQVLYSQIYNHYKNSQPNCFQIIVEDAADEFQRLQDHLNTKQYLNTNKSFVEILSNLPMINVILNAEHLNRFKINRKQAEKFSEQLKLPQSIILRLHELALFSFLDNNDTAQRAFRVQVKKRYYLNCFKNRIELFQDMEIPIFSSQKQGLNYPYLYNDQLEEDPFFRGTQNEESKDNMKKEGEKKLAQEGMKIDLKNLFEEIHNQYSELRDRIRVLVLQNKLDN